MKAADGARRVAISSAKWDVCMCRARVISNEFSFHYYKLFSRFIAFYRVLSRKTKIHSSSLRRLITWNRNIHQAI